MNYSELKKFLDYVDKRITPPMKELLNSGVDEMTRRVIYYPILTGGKRIRPALAIACCKMLGGKIKDVLYPAASIEILHNFTLIIDDIIDDSILRRKKPTCWAKFGRSITQAASIDYAAAIFQKSGQWKKQDKICEILGKAMKAIVDGEIYDILFEQAGRTEEPFVENNRYKEITEKDYFRMVSKKTASLIQASCEIGGLIAGANKVQRTLLRKYGLYLGVAFQIQDDILDIFGREEIFGKEIGHDIKERKLGNIVILLAFRKLSQADKRRFLRILRKKEITQKDIKEAVGLIQKTESRSQASTMAKSYIYNAKRNLNLLPSNKWNRILNSIADFVIEREK
ncbi:MAG TPA: polyprenyl synthetase family protein [bacterium]|nr:polyprenyl synthetase family protein [bacterium]